MNETVVAIIFSLLSHAATIVAEGKEIFADVEKTGVSAEQKTAEVLGDIITLCQTLIGIAQPSAK